MAWLAILWELLIITQHLPSFLVWATVMNDAHRRVAWVKMLYGYDDSD